MLQSPLIPVSLVVGSWLLYLTGLSFYRLTFHPYAKYPGPFLARISHLYGLYHAWKRDIHVDQRRCHEKYGDFVRYAPDHLSVRRLDAVKDIYGHGKNLKKGKAYSKLALYKNAWNTHNALDKAVHGRKRRVISQGFSDAAMKSAEPFMLEHIRNLILEAAKGKTGAIASASKNDWSPPRDISDLCQWIVLNVISDLSFGKSFSVLTSPENRFVVPAIGIHTRRQVLAFAWPNIFQNGTGNWLSIDTWLLPGFVSMRKRFVAFGKAVASETMAAISNKSKSKRGNRKDILYYILNATGSGNWLQTNPPRNLQRSQHPHLGR